MTSHDFRHIRHVTCVLAAHTAEVASYQLLRLVCVQIRNLAVNLPATETDGIRRIF